MHAFAFSAFRSDVGQYVGHHSFTVRWVIVGYDPMHVYEAIYDAPGRGEV